jgi:DNA-binding GntR family transcriptional regulator
MADAAASTPGARPMPTPPRSTVDDLSERISSGILSGRFPVGSWLRQGVLADMFGVSRQPVREALRHIQAAGLVEIHPHRGALVRGPSPRDIREAYHVRAELEGLAAGVATVRITDEELTRLAVAEQLFRRVAEDAIRSSIGDTLGDEHGWAYANDLFHEAILVAADNRVLTDAITDLHRKVPRNLTWSALRTRQQLEQNVHEHEEIRAAIQVRDGPQARSAMIKHVRRSGDLIADWFSALQTEPGDGEAGASQVTSIPPSTTIRWPVT